MADTYPLEVAIHLLDGEVRHYCQPDPQLAAVTLEGLNLQSIYNTKQFLVAGAQSTAGIATHLVERIDIMAPSIPAYRYPAHVLDIAEIGFDEFRAKVGSLAAREERTEGEEVDTLCEIDLASGARVYLRARVVIGGKLAQRQMIQNFLGDDEWHFRRSGGGVTLLNTANVMRWCLYPGVSETPKTAWLLESQVLPTSSAR